MGKVSKALEKATSEKIENSIENLNKQNNADPHILYPKTLTPLSAATDAHPQWAERLHLSISENTPIADSFKRLRTKIIHPPKGDPLRKILITSAVPGEGKGFVCANLGVALARGMSHHAILVDCDMRKPSLANIFGVPNDCGLADYLKKDIDLAHIIKKTGMPKLSLIPGGTPPNNPAELLDSQKMIDLISELTNRYGDRYILFDTPPNLVASETAVLSKHVDGIVVVVRWGGSDREQVKELVDAISREKIIGIVFNAYDENRFEHYLLKTKYSNYQYYYK